MQTSRLIRLALFSACSAITLLGCQPAENKPAPIPAPPPPPSTASAPSAPQAPISPDQIASSLQTPLAKPGGQAGALPLSQKTFVYRCEHDKTMEVTYIATGKDEDDSPVLVVLAYQGQKVGLAPAPAASGIRYVSLLSAKPQIGLEWWSKGQVGTLSQFKNGHVDKTEVLTNCTEEAEK